MERTEAKNVLNRKQRIEVKSRVKMMMLRSEAKVNAMKNRSSWFGMLSNRLGSELVIGNKDMAAGQIIKKMQIKNHNKIKRWLQRDVVT